MRSGSRFYRGHALPARTLSKCMIFRDQRHGPVFRLLRLLQLPLAPGTRLPDDGPASPIGWEPAVH